MATTYPASKQTMDSPTGADNLDSPDHATNFNRVADTSEAVQDVIGTTLGTNVLKNFTEGDHAARVSNTSVIQETWSGGTIDTSVLKTPKVNVINEETGGLGVNVDGVVHKDNDLEAAEVRTDNLTEKTTNAGININSKLNLDVFETTTVTDSTVTATTEGAAETVASLGFTLGVACKVLILLHVRTENSAAGGREFYMIHDTTTKIKTASGTDMSEIEHTTSTTNQGDNSFTSFVTEELATGAHTFNIKCWVTEGTGTVNGVMLQVIPLGT